MRNPKCGPWDNLCWYSHGDSRFLLKKVYELHLSLLLIQQLPVLSSVLTGAVACSSCGVSGDSMWTLTSSDVTLDVAWPFRFSLLIVSSRGEKNCYCNRNLLLFSNVVEMLKTVESFRATVYTSEVWRTVTAASSWPSKSIIITAILNAGQQAYDFLLFILKNYQILWWGFIIYKWNVE